MHAFDLLIRPCKKLISTSCFKSGNVLQCGPMGLSVALFPVFLLHVVVSSTFCEICLSVVEDLAFFVVYIFLFSASALTLGSPAGVGADLTLLTVSNVFLFPLAYLQPHVVAINNRLHLKNSGLKCDMQINM